MKKITSFSALLFSVLAPQFSHATLADASQRFKSDLGTQAALDATATCNLTAMMGNDGGNLGTVNTLLCVFKTIGLNATGEATKTVTIGNQSMTIHYILAAPGLTADGVTYAYSLSLWTCGSGCTSASNFWPAIFATFTADSARTINKGFLINNYGASSGSLQGTSFIKWDTGSTTTTKSIILNMVDCSSSPTTANYSVYKRTGDVATLTNLNSTASGVVNRNSFALDYHANSGNWYSDTTVSAGGDSPTWAGGYTRATSGSDWAYTAGSTTSLTIDPFTTAISGATLSGANNQGTTCADVTTNGGVTSVNNGTNVLTTPVTANGGMPVHPTSL